MVCTECGAPATHAVHDLQEDAPDGSPYTRYKLYGQLRAGCDEHTQQSMVYDREGRLIGRNYSKKDAI
jgi:hypothetical protein